MKYSGNLFSEATKIIIPIDTLTMQITIFDEGYLNTSMLKKKFISIEK